MAKNTSIWLAGLSAAALISGAALAQDTAGQKMDEAGAHSEAAADQAAAALKDAASATGEAAQDAGAAVVNTADNAADATGEALNDAGNAVVNTADNAADATGEALNDAGNAVVNTADNAADATGEALNDAGNAVVNTADNAADATGEALNDAADTTAQMADEATDVDMVDADGTPVEGQIFRQDADTFLASTILDATITNVSGETVGDVNDLVVTSDGTVTGVVVGVGGFLGIGEKDVALRMDRIDIQLDVDGDFQFVINESEEALENAPGFVTSAEQQRERERQAQTITTVPGQ